MSELIPNDGLEDAFTRRINGSVGMLDAKWFEALDDRLITEILEIEKKYLDEAKDVESKVKLCKIILKEAVIYSQLILESEKGTILYGKLMDMILDSTDVPNSVNIYGDLKYLLSERNAEPKTRTALRKIYRNYLRVWETTYSPSGEDFKHKRWPSDSSVIWLQWLA